jgi:predicted Rossmann fold nucleotide-binding protein DprA/Smf involved in DNA uptake
MAVNADLSPDTKAVLLLCGRLGNQNFAFKPLTPSEFHFISSSLEAMGLTAGQLLEIDPSALEYICKGQVDLESRVSALLARHSDLDTAISTWSKAGIWVLSERDKNFPVRLRKRLMSACPPLLFGAGPAEFLNRGGVCIVGSRNSSKSALLFSATLGAKCAKEGLTVISSDMRGVDREAVTSSLENSGKVIAVLSDRLEKTVITKRYRQALSEERLVMVTPFSPNTGFSVANAIRVNKFQYALSDVAVVVETRRKGGVWSGADENRNEGWVRAFVRSDQPMSHGNLALLHLGLSPMSQSDVDEVASLSEFFISSTTSAKRTMTRDLKNVQTSSSSFDMYSIFLHEFQRLALAKPYSESDIAKHFKVLRTQARKWLKQAERDGLAEKIMVDDGELGWLSTKSLKPTSVDK